MHKNDFLSREVFTFLFLILVLSCFVVILFLFCLIFLLCFCFVTSFHKTRIKHYCQTKNCSGYFKYFIVVNKQNGTKKHVWMCLGLNVTQVFNLSTKQPQKLFYKKSVLKNFATFTGKHQCRGLLFNKVAAWGLQLY